MDTPAFKPLRIPQGRLADGQFCNYLPIESFRSESLRLFQHFNPVLEPSRRFLSSGTTSASEAVSLFSKEGCHLYRLGALKHFTDVLQMFFPSSAKPQGFSLIPPVATWPHSSLAQMLEWIGEQFPLHYLEHDQVESLAQASSPLWLFGTAFQFVEIADRGHILSLPPGSIIFETGGTKGKVREVNRDELYSLITQTFGIPPENIVSEYGMCELSCQAYDVCPPGTHERTGFRFPEWVSVFATEGLEQFNATGHGSLIVADPLRVDFPLPFRIQDTVELRNDGSFKLLGRANTVPLKGCSLLTERRTEVYLPLQPPTAVNVPNTAVLQFLLDFLPSSGFVECLTHEFGSANIARNAVQDLLTEIPRTHADWQQAIAHSEGKPGDQILVILPKNHSLVGIYPLALAAACGLDVLVRLPAAFARSDSAISKFIAAFADTGIPRITIVPPSFRLGSDGLPAQVKGVVLYGEDQTLEEISRTTRVPLSLRGTEIVATALTSFTTASISGAIKDLLSLGQRGCCSSRVLLVANIGKQRQMLIDQLHALSKTFIGSALTLSQRVCLDYESVRIACSIPHSQIFRTKLDEPLIVWWQREQLETVREALAQQPLVIPVIEYRTTTELVADVNTSRFVTNLSTDLQQNDMWSPDLVIKPIGQANSVPWDGTSSGSPLFRFS